MVMDISHDVGFESEVSLLVLVGKRVSKHGCVCFLLSFGIANVRP